MRKIITISSIALASMLAAAAAHATDICEPHGAAEWMSEADITAKATAGRMRLNMVAGVNLLSLVAA